VLDLVQGLKWHTPSQFAPHLSYIEQISTRSPAQVDDWLVLAPQHTEMDKHISLGAGDRAYSWFGINRRRDHLFGATSNPRHRGAALRIAGALTDSRHTKTESYLSPRRGVLVVYPIIESGNITAIMPDKSIDLGKLVFAFSFVAPSSAHRDDGRVVRFTARDSSRKDAAIIDVAT
jgi:hypothetical protein